MSRVGTRSWLAAERWRRSKGVEIARGLVPPPPSAFAEFGPGSNIAPPARVLLPSSIWVGSNVTVQIYVRLSVVAAVPGVTPRLVLGDGTHIGRFCAISCVGEVVFEPDVLTADRVFVGDSYHEYADPTAPITDQGMAEPKPVRICRGAFLGVGSAVLQGCTVGENAYVGAGAVVTTDVAPRTLVVGNPARAIRRWDERKETWVPC